MGSSPRPRAMSPPDQRVIDPMRASTGTMQPSASYTKPYEPSASYHGRSSSQATADVPYSNSYDPRLGWSQRLEAHPVSTTYRSPDQSATKLRTEYTIRPRQRSSTSAADGRHPPPLRVTVSPNVPNRASPIVTSSYSRSSSPWTADPGYLVPASPRHSHRRVYYTNDASRLARPRKHQEYHSKPSSRRRYPTAENLRRLENIDDGGAYSYTTQEQLEKDRADRLDRDRGAYRHSRPLSLTGVEGHYVPSALKKESRAHGPPPSQRGFDKLEGRTRRSTYDSDRESPASRSSYRAPVALHQDWDDGYYSPNRDGRYDDGHRRRRRRHHHYHRHDSRDADYRSSKGHSRTGSASGSVEGAGTGLGTAVLASGYESDWADYPHPYDYTRHHNRSRRSSRRRGTDTDAYGSDDDLHTYRHEPSARRESPSSKPLAIEEPRVHRTSRSRTRVADGHHSSRHVSSSSQEDPRKRTESEARKSNDSNSPKDSEPQIKGILKPPRERFPEDPNPVREGVAPLKDAHKKGVPQDARWTRIDRRLVNPAALEGKERFTLTDEQPDCVFVLRVLTKEEIQAYAIRTHEIRHERYREYREHREQRRRGKEERRRSGEEVSDDSEDSEDSDDDEDEDTEQLTLPSSQQSHGDP